MARERRSIDQMIEELDGKIAKWQERIKTLKLRKAELLQEKDRMDFQELENIMVEKGLTPVQVVEILKAQ